jgi:glycosyltransferase involved in cell wall biosynthesis
MKVLWFSNIEIANETKGSGSWISNMANILIKREEIQLYVIATANVSSITRKDYQSITQWLIPAKGSKKDGLPSNKIIVKIQNIRDEIMPDIIHIWGTEYYWGLLTGRGYITGNTILEIQGLKFEIRKYFFSGLTLAEILKCIGIKEILKPSVSLMGIKCSFNRWEKYEKEIILKHKNISTQSNWVRANIKEVNPEAKVYKTTIPLRSEFFESNKWEINHCNPYQIYTSSSSDISYKGLHILLKALQILKKRYPEIKLCIAGTKKSGLKESGYSKYLTRTINQLGISKNVIWLGTLDALNIVEQMVKSNVVVIPSFIESYCLAFEEALSVGVPTVASFAGAMPELASHLKTAIFFPPGDVIMCAYAIDQIFANRDFAISLSENATKVKRHIREINAAEKQISIYNNIISNC